MKKILLSVLTFQFASVLAHADVRDDFRNCEQIYFPRIKNVAKPQATKAAEQYCLGLGYWFKSNYNRLPHDPALAAYWHQQAASQGHLAAEVALAYHYEKGNGVQQDVAQAAKLYLAAAQQGEPSAMFNYGRLLSLGRGVTKNEQEADKWFRQAEAAGSSDAKVHYRQKQQYEVLESAGRETFAEGYKAFQAKEYESAASLFAKAAEQGNVSAKYSLGQLYRQGLGVPKDPVKAVELYRQAADKGHARAQAQLGLSYEEAEGVAEDWKQALAWYQKSALQLDALGLLCLGRMYQFGMAVPQDRDIAVRIFEKAQNQDERQAGFFANWLRVKSNCLGYRDDAEREKYAGVCSDPRGITFANSKERRAWMQKTLDSIPVNMFGSSSYMQGACGSIGGDFRGGNCYGFGGAIIDPFTSGDRFGNPG